MKRDAVESLPGGSEKKHRTKSEYPKHLEKRSHLQKSTWVVLPAVAGGGWLYPPLGYLMMACMAGAVGIAFFRGRAWCDWMCPRGAALDLFLKKSPARRRSAGFLHSWWTRAFMMALMMTVLGAQVYRHWGDWLAVGFAFVLLLTVTTVLAIILGFAFRERAWCMICPMGTVGALLSTGKEPLRISTACDGCGACAKVCPMDIRPFAHRDAGVVAENDCLKCGGCVAVCPGKALNFDEVPGSRPDSSR